MEQTYYFINVITDIIMVNVINTAYGNQKYVGDNIMGKNL